MLLHTARSLRALLVVLTALGMAAMVSPAVADETIPTTTELEVQGGGLYGDELVLTATVTSESGTPTGSVQFLDGAEPMGDPVPVDGSGVAVHTSKAVVGLHSYRAEFTGAGDFAASSDAQFHVTIASGMVIRPEPTILAPGLRPTLTMSAHAKDVRGRPVVGETLSFKVNGSMPNPFDSGGGRVICHAVTDARGFASCRGKGLVGSVLSLLAARSYVWHQISANYGFSAAVAPVIKLR